MQIFFFLTIIALSAAKQDGYIQYGPPKYGPPPVPGNQLMPPVLQYIQSPPERLLLAPPVETAPTYLPPVENSPNYLPPTQNAISSASSLPFASHPSSNIYPLPQVDQQPVIRKFFYFHSAPEQEDVIQPKIIRIGRPRKTYRVVFIKTPASKQSIQISTAPVEEKTIVYVLTKKVDTSDIQADVNIPSTPPSKPEVFFIKYKTHEEAQHVQHHIQAQYDSLGGTSQVSDEGLAPVTSVVGSLDVPVQSENGYLPPHKL